MARELVAKPITLLSDSTSFSKISRRGGESVADRFWQAQLIPSMSAGITGDATPVISLEWIGSDRGEQRAPLVLKHRKKR